MAEPFEDTNVVQAQQSKPISRIIITFAEPNSTLLDIHYDNASPLQVMTAGWVLMKSAEDAIEDIKKQQESQQKREKIAVPSGYGKMIPK